MVLPAPAAPQHVNWIKSLRKMRHIFPRGCLVDARLFLRNLWQLRCLLLLPMTRSEDKGNSILGKHNRIQFGTVRDVRIRPNPRMCWSKECWSNVLPLKMKLRKAIPLTVSLKPKLEYDHRDTFCALKSLNRLGTKARQRKIPIYGYSLKKAPVVW